ncbi:hypothetical protein [Streptomyces sp. NPDC090080]|uniref:hypothetical protein n=1 Tax=Streptomyces sp. NPDC090080 TaxID=3365939 RepID=UPI00380A550F
MQQTFVSCHPESTRAPKPAQNASIRRKRWMPDPAETVTHTASRRTGPRAWLRALQHAAAAGLVPGFTATTQRIVAVLAGRMDYDTGHARYVLTDVMERTGLSRTAVTGHVRLLRAGGWLAWAEHGSRGNALRPRGLPGYARTATVYAATIPPHYDARVGNTVAGAGYLARLIPRTPSLWWVEKKRAVQVVGGQGASTANAANRKPTFRSTRRPRQLTVTGYKITSARIERARQTAQSVRPLVNWIQRSTLAELSWVLLDLVAQDWSEPRIRLWLHRLGQDLGAPRWRARAPHRVIAAALRHMAHTNALTAVPADIEHEEYHPSAAPNRVFQQAITDLRKPPPNGNTQSADDVNSAENDPQRSLTKWELAQLREAARTDPALVLSYAHIHGPAAAIETYGTMAQLILSTPAAYTSHRATLRRQRY